MKTIRFFLMLAVATFMVACNNDEDPAPIVPEEPGETEVPNKLVGTRWVADPDNHNNIPYLWQTEAAAIEFIANQECIIDLIDSFDNSIHSLRFTSIYDETTDTILIDQYNDKLSIEDNLLTTTLYDNIGNPFTYTFVKDSTYVAPAKDNGIVGHYKGLWILEGIQYSAWITILDNERLIAADNSVLDYKHRSVVKYSYDGKYISFRDRTCKISGNQITGDGITYTKQ